MTSSEAVGPAPSLSSSDSPQALSHHGASAAPRRVAAAGLLGTVIEYFDFSIYTYLAIYFSPLFFATTDPTTALLAALAVFGSAYLMRPLGGLVLGALGDRIGRRPVLVLTILGMGIAATGIGVLPTYQSIGLAAPVLLLVFRLAQGFSAGGEQIGASTYVVEAAPVRSRAVYGAVVPIGQVSGFAFAALTVAVVSSLLTREEMAAWGWRIPFLLCAPLTLFCLWLRLRLEDSPTFRALADKAQIAKAPIREALRTQWRNIVRVAVIAFAINAPVFLGLIYMSTYLVQGKHFAPTSVYITTAVALLLSAVFYPLSGLLAERFGRRRILLTGATAYVFLTYPFLMLVDASTSLFVIGVALVAYLAIYSTLGGTALTVFAELFPTRVRFTAAALGNNVGVVLAGGVGPYLAAQLVVSTGNPLSPAFWGIGASLIGIVAILLTPETRRTDLNAA